MEDPISKKLFSAFEDETSSTNNISGDISKECPKKEPMKVVLRVKPFTQKDKSSKENQGCIVLKDNGKVELRAPQDSFQFKSSIRGLTDQTHEFSFSRVFDENTKQKELFDEIMLPFVKDILDGQNGLVFTYGVTNSGKTYTIQGTPKDGGILPRSLDVVFNSISKKLYSRANLKPKHCYDVVALSPEEEAQEDLIRKAIFHACDKENIDLSTFKTLNSTTKSDSSTSSANSTFLSNISMISASKGGTLLDDRDITEEIKTRIADATSLCVERQGNVRFGVWISFMEIYNELIYDLLDLTPIGKGRKRATLKLGDDKNGKPYVKGLREIFVTSSDEAYKVLRLGQKNRHIASTKLNMQSSRSHCIFNIKLLKIVDVSVGQPHVARISRLSIVDLAGSERYCNTGAKGDLLRQAGNINASIMTLGKCISTLRYNQEHPNHQTIIPFRESKLTRLFQSFFLGKGKASMIVNVSQCASVFDETYHVLKFSAVAKQVKMKAERATEFWRVPPLPKVPATPSTSKRPPLTMVTPATSRKRTLEKPTDFSYDELVNIVGELRDKVRKERLEKGNLETTIRREVTQEMNELIVEIESSHNTELMDQKHNLEDLMEKRLDLLTKTVNKRKRKRTDESSSVSDESQVSFALIEAEKLKVKERDDLILTLQSKVQELEAEQNFFKKTCSPEDRSKQIDILTKDIREAKETLNVQNEAIEEMQNMLQRKDDEIDKLREALDDEETNTDSTALVKELQELLEATTKELDNARVKLDNRDICIKELEAITSGQKADNEELTKICSKQEEWLRVEKEKNAQLVSEVKVLQFENDEFTFKVDKYETNIKDHQAVLSENETFIEQLNKEVADLKEKLERFEEKEKEPAHDNVVVKEDEAVKIRMNLEEAERQLKERDEKIERLQKQNQCYEAVTEKTPAGKLKQHALVYTPDPYSKLSTPVKKLNNATPTRSPYSPATKATNQQLVKKLEKMLDEKTKELDKKNSVVVQKTNRVQHLEQQLSALEKKTAIKELRAENEAMESNVETLTKELAKSQQVQNELNFKLVNHEENSVTFEAQVTELTQKYETAMEELANLQQEHECLQKQLEEDQRHQSCLLQQVEGSLKKACDKNDVLSNKMKELENQNETLASEVQGLKEQENTHKQERSELQRNLETTTKTLTDAKKELEETNSHLQALKLEKERVAESSKKLAKQLENRRKSRMFVDNQLATTVDGYEDRIKSLHEEIDDLNQEKELLKTQISQITQQNIDEKNFKEQISSLKKSEQELLEKISMLEEKMAKYERDAQMLSTVKIKLEMKVKTLENEVSEQVNKLSVCEEEAHEFGEQVKELSEKLNKTNKEVLELTQENDKIQRQNHNNFKKIVGLEKQKAETEAIISSLQEGESKTVDYQQEIKSLHKKVVQLQDDVTEKGKQVLKLKTECQIQDENVSMFEVTKKENIELKESLVFKEKELKRATEEKKFALDELLKQTVKSKRNITASKDISTSDSEFSVPSDKSDMDYKTSAKRKKKERIPITTRMTRSAKKVIPEDEISTVESENETKSEEKENMDTTEKEQNESSMDDDYVYSVSIALSPIVFDEQPVDEREDEDTKQTKFLDISNGSYVALSEYGEYTDPPIIGKVVTVEGEHATVEILEGGYNKIWKPLVEEGGDGAVVEKIHRGLIIFNDINFTSTKRLPSEVKRCLHRLYLNNNGKNCRNASH